MSALYKTDSLSWVNFFTGITDGFILSFALCIFLFQTHSLSEIGWTAMACCLGGSLIFGLARTLSELSEIRQHHPQLSEKAAQKEDRLLKKIGLDEQLQATMQLDRNTEKKLWLQEMEQNKMGWQHLNKARARKAGLQTAAGFLSGGMLTLMLLGIFAVIVQLELLLPLFAEILISLLSIAVLLALGAFKAQFKGLPARAGILYYGAYGVVCFAGAFLLSQLLPSI